MREGAIKEAIDFAKAAHAGQVRKYTGEEYYTHPLEVARIVHTHVVDHTQEMIVAAVLHDTVEDTDTTIEDIRIAFGDTVAEYVFFLSDVSVPSDGNRAVRKLLDRSHIAKAPAAVKSIKLADLIDNTKSITAHDPRFAKVYMAEKVLLLDVLHEGDSVLFAIAKSQVEEYTK